ncbi:POK19 protein, partial [Neodrepanis coruscans]|nr:POK19 protein [Neodrepanis coruscans]
CAKTVGSINWVHMYLGLTTKQLAPLFDLLKGDPDLLPLRQLTPEADKALTLVEEAVNERQVYQVETGVPVSLYIAIHDNHLVGISG